MTADFDHIAEEYHASVPPIHEDLPDRLIQIGSLVARSRVVELGCGSGQLVLALAARGMRVSGVDCSPKLIEIARSQVQNKLVEWVSCHAEKYIPSDAPIDLYVAYEAFHLFEDKGATVMLAERYLRPGGTLCVGWCEYHWEKVLKEAIVAAFEGAGMPWGDWGYYTCDDFPEIVATRCRLMTPPTLTSFEVATHTPIHQIAAFLTSIGKAAALPKEQRVQLRTDLENRFVSLVAANMLSGSSKYYLMWCRNVS